MVSDRSGVEEAKTVQREDCANVTHGPAVVRVRCRPSCGEIVNARIPVGNCPDQEHAQARRARRAFCVNGGQQLIEAGVGR